MVDWRNRCFSRKIAILHSWCRTTVNGSISIRTKYVKKVCGTRKPASEERYAHTNYQT